MGLERDTFHELRMLDFFPRGKVTGAKDEHDCAHVMRANRSFATIDLELVLLNGNLEFPSAGIRTC